MSHMEMMGLYTMLPQIQRNADRLDALGARLVKSVGGVEVVEGKSKKDKKLEFDISKSITKLLRYDMACITMVSTDQAGYVGSAPMDGYGRVSVDWLIGKLKKNHPTINSEVVIRLCDSQESDDRRYAIVKIDGVDMIYCFQGHINSFYKLFHDSGVIEIDKIFHEITETCDAIHSTKLENVTSIMDTGLQFSDPTKKSRQIHGSSKQGDAEPGRFVHMWNHEYSEKKGRKGATAWISVNMKEAMQDGVKFYRAGNGVILATAPINAKFLTNITAQMGLEIENSPGAKADVVEEADDTPEYVSWKSLPDTTKTSLRMQFLNDLWDAKTQGRQSAEAMLEILCGGIKGDTSSLKSELVSYLASLTTKKYNIVATVYGSVQLDGLYMVMVNGKNDPELENLGVKYGFPRGMTVLWKPNHFMDIRGFHPKFPNDSKENEAFKQDLLDGSISVRFFLKWSGYLTHIVAFEYEGGVYWTVCTKQVAFKEGVPFFEWSRSLLAGYMQDKALVGLLAKERIYLGAEALCVDDVHGYIVKQNDFVVTCISTGVYLDLTEGGNSVDSKTPGKLISYRSVEEIAAFCGTRGLPFDTGYTLSSGRDSEHLKKFISDLFVDRDLMTCSLFRTRIGELETSADGSVTVTRHPGTKSHEDLVGDVLEGFVMNVSYESTKRTFKVKLPYYTWRTFFLREWLDEMFKGQDEEDFSFASPSIPSVELVTQSTFDKIEAYLSRWCFTSNGQKHFKLLCSGAVMALQTQLKEIVEFNTHYQSSFQTATEFRQRLHVLLADYMEGQDIDKITDLANDFQRQIRTVGLRLVSARPTIFVCVGPVGYGKSVSTSRLSEECTDMPVDVIDGDNLTGSLDSTLALGSERNFMTLAALWKSLMAGRIPLLSVGGGSIVEFGRNGISCMLKKYVSEIFHCDVRLVVAVMEDVSTSRRRHIVNLKEKLSELGSIANVVDEVYTVRQDYITKVLNGRVSRKEVTAKSDGANSNFMFNLSNQNKAIASAILEAADDIFSIPCMPGCDDPLEFITKTCEGWRQVTKCMSVCAKLTGDFAQLRAVVFKRKKADDPALVDVDGKACHITLYHTEDSTIAAAGGKLRLCTADLEKIHNSIMQTGRIWGRGCRMVLEPLISGKGDPGSLIGIEDSDLMTGSMTTGIEEPQDHNALFYHTTEFNSIEEMNTDPDSKNTLQHALSAKLSKWREGIPYWSDQEVMSYKLTKANLADESLHSDQFIIYSKKCDLFKKIDSLQKSLAKAGSIEAAYIPGFDSVFSNIPNVQGRLAHITLSTKKIKSMCSSNMIRWFLSEEKSPLILAGDSGINYMFKNPRPTMDYKILVKDNDTPQFVKGSGLLLEQTKKAVEGNCFLDDTDTEFLYFGLVPVR